MAIGSPDKAARLEQLRGYARVQVWSGYADDAQVRREVAEAVRDEVRDEDRVRVLVDELVEAAHDDLAKAAATWPVETSYDRFQQALRALEQADVVVLEACQDHWSADAELRRRSRGRPSAARNRVLHARGRLARRRPRDARAQRLARQQRQRPRG